MNSRNKQYESYMVCAVIKLIHQETKALGSLDICKALKKKADTNTILEVLSILQEIDIIQRKPLFFPNYGYFLKKKIQEGIVRPKLYKNESSRLSFLKNIDFNNVLFEGNESYPYIIYID